MNNTLNYKGFFASVNFSEEDNILFGKKNTTIVPKRITPQNILVFNPSKSTCTGLSHLIVRLTLPL